MSIAAKKLYFDIPGVGRVHAMPGGSFDPGGFTRTKKQSDIGSVGHTEEPVAPKLTFKIAARKDDGLNERTLSDLVDVNVTVTSDHGKVWIVRGCVTTKPTTFSDGEYDVEMEGDSAEGVS